MAGQRVVLEFSSPNIAKPFHAGHLRSTLLGGFLQRVFAACGASTHSINYLGDWGKQYGLLGVGFGKYGIMQALESDPIKHLFEVYVAINRDAAATPSVEEDARTYFQRLEMGDAESMQVCRQCWP
jgi:arginyl-tRNA synthetase